MGEIVPDICILIKLPYVFLKKSALNKKRNILLPRVKKKKDKKIIIKLVLSTHICSGDVQEAKGDVESERV